MITGIALAGCAAAAYSFVSALQNPAVALSGLGVAWLELRREARKAPEAQPVMAP